MRRIVVGAILVLALALTGCAQALGTAEWDRIEVAYTSPDDPGLTMGDYTLLVTPTEVSYTVNGESRKGKLPEGAWVALTTGVRPFGDRKGVACSGEGEIRITAFAAGAVKQDFEANGCDAGDAFRQAEALMAQIIAQIK